MTEPRGTNGAGDPQDPGSPNGHLCPECGTPRAADNTPSCGCGERASEALRDARTAEAAAAGDFDPLRIRPYVELEGDNAAETMQLRQVDPQQPAPPARAAADDAQTLATPLASGATTPNAQDLSLFESTPATAPAPATADEADWDDSPSTARRPRHRRTVLLGAGGALVVVMTAAGLASGMFSYDAPSRKTALPHDVRASVPAPSTGEAETTAAPTETASGSAPAPTSASPSESPTESPSPTRSTSSPSPTPSTEPTKSPSPTEATTDPDEESPAARQPTPPVLSRGDRGPEVTELELRLTQLGLYTRQARGNYNEGVEDAVARYQWARGIQTDDYGVYDLETRERLESETTEP
ncbi:peptidoglycan-binding domain-containing protein [Streptomyces chartreusis]|uniref:peptidoglycan-binding domain-containing protein n=1 Tax=Streptomyces chartreusis TaxID=1969 RepID=UPI0021019FF0|nr:peptidoglycan-binding protein [Streptomyces chartreusis]